MQEIKEVPSPHEPEAGEGELDENKSETLARENADSEFELPEIAESEAPTESQILPPPPPSEQPTPHILVKDIVDMRKQVDEAGMGKGQDPLKDQAAIRRAFEEMENQNPNA